MKNIKSKQNIKSVIPLREALLGPTRDPGPPPLIPHNMTQAPIDASSHDSLTHENKTLAEVEKRIVLLAIQASIAEEDKRKREELVSGEYYRDEALNNLIQACKEYALKYMGEK
jgi:hypothetical protein